MSTVVASTPPLLREVPFGRLSLAAAVLAAIVAVVSLVGLLLPAIWGGESASWAAQGIGQDGFDLFVLVPVLALSAIGVHRGSRAALVVLAGALVFTIYTFVIYTFAVHFNPLFLGYCAALGVAFYSLIGTTRMLATRGRSDYPLATPARTGGVMLMAMAVVFALLWLGEIVPALWHGTVPASIRDSGLLTNPVHVLDLAIVLPAMFVAGLALFRRRPLGRLLAPMLLVFNAIMALSLTTLFVVMQQRGLPSSMGLAVALGLIAGASGWLAWRMLRHLPRTT